MVKTDYVKLYNLQLKKYQIVMEHFEELSAESRLDIENKVKALFE